ncbi:MAG TPA: hypothetical protein VF653_09435 [Methylomirabilota bacterium]
MEPYEVDLLTPAVLRDLEKVDDTFEAGSASQLRSDVVKPDGQN